MPESMNSNSDFVRELRLRQWARRHFVAVAARKTTWHPVVLDEMERRDREVFADTMGQIVSNSENQRFDQTELRAVEATETVEIQQESLFVDASAEDTILKRPGTSSIGEQNGAFNIGAKIVPLVPDWGRQIDGVGQGVPKPHFRHFAVGGLELSQSAQRLHCS